MPAWRSPAGLDRAARRRRRVRAAARRALLARRACAPLEFVYGAVACCCRTARDELGEFPPRHADRLQSALYHAGLRFMELELGHALFDKPNDWGLVHRMMRVGVRIGMVDEATVDYWPSLRAQTSPQRAPRRMTAAA